MRVEKLDTEIRREQIIQATLVLIAAQGLEGVSIAAIARRVGLVPSAIYRHFKSKEELIDATLELIRARLHSNVRAVLHEDLDPLETLHRLLMRHVRLIRENQAIPRIVFSEDVHRGRPERRMRIHRIIQGYLAEVQDIVRRGQTAHRIRSDIDPEAVSLMFLGLVQPAGLLWIITDGGFDITKQVRKAWRVFAEAIERAEGGGRSVPPGKRAVPRHGVRKRR